MRQALLLLVAAFSFAFLAYSNALSGQSLSLPTPASAGGSTLNGTTHLSYTVGEAGSGTYSQPALILTAGFQQADPSGIPLPFLQFNLHGSRSNATTRIYTETETNLEIKTWVLERSLDGQLFEERDRIAAPASGQHFWEDNVNLNAPVLYYRLRLIDLDGQTFFSPVLSLYKSREVFALTLYPNPARDEAFLSYQLESPSRVMLTDVQGKVVWSSRIEAGQGILPIPARTLAAGSYYVHVRNPEAFRSFPLIIRH